jgi:lysophospholipase L1-like esterase
MASTKGWFPGLAVWTLVLAPASATFAQEHWVATWAAAPQETRAFAPPPGPPAAQPGAANQQPAAPLPPPPIMSFQNQTVRMTVRTSIGGRRLRVELSNAFGTKPLTVGAAHVALREKDSAIVTGTDRPLAFSGKPSFTIPPGAQALSDAVDLNVPPLSDLAISLYLPGETGLPTMHGTGLHTTYIASGDMAGAAAITNPIMTRPAWYYISGVHVAAPADTGLIVAFGDSITDGATSTVDADKSWPSQFARRVLANSATQNIAVVNEGISGNRVLRDIAGANALARLDRDVFSQPGVRWMTLMEGINDIGRATGRGAPASDAVTADEVIAGLRQIVERAHLHGIKVLGATLTPYEGAAYYSETGESMRQAVNRWIRTGGAFDGLVDFDAVVRDPANALQIKPDFNIRDHLHPNDPGYQAMAEAIDLAIFGGARSGAAAAR